MGPTSSSEKESPSAHPGLVLASIFDKNIPGRGRNYVLQCCLSAVSPVIILLMKDVLLRAAVVVAMASRAFTIYVLPKHVAATLRRVGRGICGRRRVSFLDYPFDPRRRPVDNVTETHRYICDVLAALWVGLGILVLVVIDTEHSPAAWAALEKRMVNLA